MRRGCCSHRLCRRCTRWRGQCYTRWRCDLCTQGLRRCCSRGLRRCTRISRGRRRRRRCTGRLDRRCSSAPRRRYTRCPWRRFSSRLQGHGDTRLRDCATIWLRSRHSRSSLRGRGRVSTRVRGEYNRRYCGHDSSFATRRPVGYTTWLRRHCARRLGGRFTLGFRCRHTNRLLGQYSRGLHRSR